jgi:fructose-bisphosphate aldolase class II
MIFTMKELLDRASAENYAIAAPNVGNSCDVDAAIAAAEALNAPLILDVRFENLGPEGPKKKAFPRDLAFWMQIRSKHAKIPIAINEDHGASYKAAVLNVQAGCTSIMADRSSLPYEENVEGTKQVCELAHAANISCEGELGHVGNASAFSDSTYESGDSFYTNVEQAVDFVKRTGIDCLAISIGTAHGKYPDGFVPKLDLDRLVSIKKAVSEAVGYSYPLVLHGSSGTPNELLKKACSMGINKVNINTDLTIAAMQSVLVSGGKGNVWQHAMEGFKNKLMEMIPIYGSDGKAWKKQ